MPVQSCRTELAALGTGSLDSLAAPTPTGVFAQVQQLFATAAIDLGSYTGNPHADACLKDLEATTAQTVLYL